MGIGAGDTYFKPLEEIGSRLSKDRALTLFETSESIRWLYGKMDFNGDRNLFPFQVMRRKNALNLLQQSSPASFTRL